MILKNFYTLTIRVQDFNIIASQPVILAQLRNLTLHPSSGMNYELDRFEKFARYRKVKAKILTAFRGSKMVGWAFLSKEPTDFTFRRSPDGFEPSQGTLFQIYIHEDYRRCGIASELIKVARRKAGVSRLCICPWDPQSSSFYNKFDYFKAKLL